MTGLFLGIASADALVLSACKEALRGLGAVRALPPERSDVERALHLDLLVLDVEAPGACATLVQACSAANPGMHLIVTAPDPGPEAAVELLHLGAADFVARPPALEVLRRKVRRILTGVPAPVFEHPALGSLVPTPVDDDRRDAYRAIVAPEEHATLRLRVGGREVVGAVCDIALAGERAPGSLLLRVSAAEVPPFAWMRVGGEDLEAWLDVHDDYAEPVAVRVRARKMRYRIRRREVDVVLQYRSGGTDAGSRLGRFWIRCQGRAAPEPE